jgi:DNA-binding NtrC family response regulator
MLKQADGQDWIQISRDGQNSPGVEFTGRILVVDDDPHFLRVLARILSGENFLVTSAAGACDALELLKSAQFDLVISDLRMPECDGLNLLESLRGSGNTLPVIILTAYGEVDTYLAAMNAGATEYLNKPIQSDELLKSVRACLRWGKNRGRGVSSDKA